MRTANTAVANVAVFSRNMGSSFTVRLGSFDLRATTHAQLEAISMLLFQEHHRSQLPHSQYAVEFYRLFTIYLQSECDLLMDDSEGAPRAGPRNV
jgi:hypothetical protein